MKWARLTDNKVMEVIEFDPTGRFTDELVSQFVQCPDEVEQNWTYVEGIWNAPVLPEVRITPPTLEERIADLEAAIAAILGGAE